MSSVVWYFQFTLCSVISIKNVCQFVRPHLNLIYFLITYFNEVLNKWERPSCHASLLDELLASMLKRCCLVRVSHSRFGEQVGVSSALAGGCVANDAFVKFHEYSRTFVVRCVGVAMLTEDDTRMWTNDSDFGLCVQLWRHRLLSRLCSLQANCAMWRKLYSRT